MMKEVIRRGRINTNKGRRYMWRNMINGDWRLDSFNDAVTWPLR